MSPAKTDVLARPGEQINGKAENGFHANGDSPPSCYGSYGSNDGMGLSASPYANGIYSNGYPAKKEWRTLEASEHSQNTINPIRRIVDVMAVEPNPNKTLIKLHLGDPTMTGNLPSHPAVVEAFVQSVMSGNFNGYGPAVGLAEVRQVLASKVTTAQAPVVADDIILTSGCSHALQLAIEAVANPGDNILLPSPGFPLYSTLMKPHAIQEKYYNLLVDKDWEIDVEQMESLIDSKTRAILVNNPSNPCGSVFSRQLLTKVLEVAERHKLIIIADEIYGDLTWDGAEFVPMAQLEPKVPIICCDGIGKRYLVPGWRLGWLIVHDPNKVLSRVREGLRHLAQKIVGPCGPVQGALPAILENTPKSFFDNTRSVLSRNAQVAYSVLQGTPGIRPVKPHGAMYMMIGIDTTCFPHLKGNQMEFIKGLISEESVYCLPGSAFHFPDSFRIVLAYPEDVTHEACERIRAYCLRHYCVRSSLHRLSIGSPRPTFTIDQQEWEEDDSPPLSPSPPPPSIPLGDSVLGGVLRRKFTATML